MGRVIAGEHFYGPTSPEAVDIPPRLGALCVVTCARRDGRAVDLAVVERRPSAGWQGVGDERQRRAWRDACDGVTRVWHRLYGPDAEATAEREALAARIRAGLGKPGR